MIATLNLRDRIVGLEREVPLLDGRRVPYVNLDNAASTPPLIDVVRAVDEFMPFYSSVHRGTGFKSRLSTVAYDQAHAIIGRFVGADPRTNTVIFGKNATEAINKLAWRLPLGPEAVVITTQLEHHSNDLPWRPALTTMLRWFREEGGQRVVVNSDAHRVGQMGANLDLAAAVLHDAGLTAATLQPATALTF